MYPTTQPRGAVPTPMTREAENKYEYALDMPELVSAPTHSLKGTPINFMQMSPVWKFW